MPLVFLLKAIRFFVVSYKDSFDRLFFIVHFVYDGLERRDFGETKEVERVFSR